MFSNTAKQSAASLKVPGQAVLRATNIIIAIIIRIKSEPALIAGILSGIHFRRKIKYASTPS